MWPFRRKPADDTGLRGERLAERHLRRLGMRILARRFRVRGGELDLVAEDAGTLVFVEVKTTGSARHDPAERITRTKLDRLTRAARAYVRNARREDAACRFDAIIVLLNDAEAPTIRHVRDAFTPRHWS